MRTIHNLVAATLFLAIAGCGKHPAADGRNANADVSKAATVNAAAPNGTSTNRQVYRVKGLVKEVLSPKRVKVAHEEIPGYMVAMTMPFDVKNTNELVGINKGDQITFDMVVTDDDGWIEHVARVGGPTNDAPATSFAQTNKTASGTNEVLSFRRVREVEPLAVGDVMPDYPFVTEEGKPLRLSELKGQAVAFTFIFTRCPFPTFCPRMSSNFEKVAQEMQKAGLTNWHLLSISFDPKFDTPERLKEHARKFQRDPEKWNFVTGEMIEIDAITEQFGLVFANRNGSIDHNLRSVIVDANGRIRDIYIGNEWPVAEFVDEFIQAARAKPGDAPPKAK